MEPFNSRRARVHAPHATVASSQSSPEPVALNRPLAFAMASASAVFLTFLSVLGQLATRELSVVPTLFFRFLASGLVILAVLRGEAWQTLARIGRPEWLSVGSVLISQFCLFLYLERGSLLIGVLLYNTGWHADSLLRSDNLMGHVVSSQCLHLTPFAELTHLRDC